METPNNSQVPLPNPTPSPEQPVKVAQGEAKGLIDQAVEVESKLDAKLKQFDELITRGEALYAKQRLGGQANAGKQEEVKTEQQQIEELANDISKRLLGR